MLFYFSRMVRKVHSRLLWENYIWSFDSVWKIFFKELKISYFCLMPFRCKGQPHASGMNPEDISGCPLRPAVNWFSFFTFLLSQVFHLYWQQTALSLWSSHVDSKSVGITSHSVSLLCGNAVLKVVNWEMFPISYSLKVDWDVRDILNLSFLIKQ